MMERAFFRSPCVLAYAILRGPRFRFSIRTRRFPRKLRPFLALLAVLLSPLLPATVPAWAQAPIILRVDRDATGTPIDGSTWDQAFREVQSALAAAALEEGGVEIWVAEGVYYPDEGAGQEDDERFSTFFLRDDVAVYGGFVGGEIDRDQRNPDPATNGTVLSGDLMQDDGPGGTDDNAYHVVTCGGEVCFGSTAVLDGFTITAGNAEFIIGVAGDAAALAANQDGGGMTNAGGAPTLANLFFSGNQAEGEGGGLFNDDGTPVLSNVVFSDNQAFDGGGLYNNGGSPVLANVVFSGNAAGNNGGGFFNDNGAPVLANVVFSGNVAEFGGGLYLEGGSSVFTNLTFAGNRAETAGGGAFFFAFVGPFKQQVTSALTNAIFWDNAAAEAGDQIFIDGEEVTISRSLIQGGCPFGASCFGLLPEADPRFVTPVDPATAPTTAGDLRLRFGSPALDAGDTGALPPDTADLDGDGDVNEPLPLDLDLEARVQDAAVDLGPYEGFEGCPAGPVVFVDADAVEGNDDGTSWADAFVTLQTALVAAEECPGVAEIWVAEGVYYPDEGAGQVEDDQFSTFFLLDDVAVYGGFTGVETDRDQRNPDPATNGTVLSGDLEQDDGGEGGVFDNAFSVVTCDGEVCLEPTAVLDGFTITAGNAVFFGERSGEAAALDADGDGGGMINAGSPTLSNLIFSGNQAEDEGGGLFNEDGAPVLSNVVFSDNQALDGGGLYNLFGAPVLVNVVFTGNQAEASGGGLFDAEGSLELTNVVFSGNEAGSAGGGMYNRFVGDLQASAAALGDATLTNVTFSGNRSGFGGGLYNEGGSAVLTNAILWNNDAAEAGDQVFVDGGSVTLDHVLIQGGCPLDASCVELIPEADPRFIEPVDPATAPTTAGNLRLGFGSPAVDAGDTGALPPDAADLDGDGDTTEPLPLDLDLTARVFNQAGGGVVDLGPYESTFTPAMAATKTALLSDDRDGSGTVSPGDELTYTVVLFNGGGAPALDVVFSDDVDAHTLLDCGSVDPAPASCTGGSGGGFTIDFTGTPLASDDGFTILFSVDVVSPLPAGVQVVSNQGDFSSLNGGGGLTDDPGTGAPADPTVTPIDAAPDLRLVKGDGDVSVRPGDDLAYLLEFDNAGNQNASGVRLIETVPVGTVFDARASTPGWACSPDNRAGSRCTLAVGDLPAGEAGEPVDFVVNVEDPLPAGLTQIDNTATIADDNASGPDRDRDDNTDRELTPVVAAAAFRATKTDAVVGGGPAEPGGEILYTVVLTNTGNQGAAGVVFSDVPGAGSALVAGSVTTTAGTVTVGNSAGDAAVAVTIPEVAVAGTVTITFRVEIDDPFPEGANEVSNQGTVAAGGAPGVPTDDPATPIPNDPTVTPLGAAPRLVATKADTLFLDGNANGLFNRGDQIQYTVEVANAGDQDVPNVVFADTPDPVTTLNAGSVTTSQGSITSGNQAGATSVRVEAGTLAAGGPPLTITFVVTIADPLTGGVEAIANQGAVTAGEALSILTDDPGTPALDDPTVSPLDTAPTVEPSAHDYGQVIVGAGAAQVFVLTNEGSSDLQVTGLTLGGEDPGQYALTGVTAPFTVGPGESTEIEVTFLPTVPSPPSLTAVLEIMTDHPDRPQIEVALTGQGAEGLTVSPAALDFGAVRVGETRPLELLLTTNRTEGVEVSRVVVEGSSDFGVSDPGPFTVEPGPGFSLAVTFGPAARGAQSATLRIESDDEARPLIDVPLAGQGVAPALEADPEALAFGSRAPGRAATLPLTLLNAGDAPLNVSQVALVGPDAGVFQLEGAGPFVLDPQEPRTLQVGFAPPAEGEYTAAVRIESDDPAAPVLDVALTGRSDEIRNGTPAQADAGTAVEASVIVPDDLQGATGRLFFRMGGQPDFTQEQSVPLTGLGDTFRANIPSAFVTPRGVLYFASFDVDGEEVTFPAQDPLTNPAQLRVRIDELAADPPFAPGVYRMISVPVDLQDRGVNAVLVDDYDPYDPRRWRLLRWNEALNGGQGDYEEHEREPGLSAVFAPGIAFWLVTQAGTGFDVEDGLSVDLLAPPSLVLQPGWNQIANPFAFPVASGFITERQDLDGPYFFDGATRDFRPCCEQVLLPWQGYFVENTSGAPVTLAVQSVEAPGGLAEQAAEPAFLAASGFVLQLSASLEGLGLHDAQTFLGFADQAAEGRDRLDFSKPPGIGDHLRVSILQDGQQLGGSFKPAGEGGRHWDVAVTAILEGNRPADGAHVRVTLQEYGTRPDGFELYVLDQDLGRTLPVHENAFGVALSTAHPVRHLRVVVGTEAFAEAQREAAVPALDRHVLEQNYPNPFRTETVIRYGLRGRSRVELVIYDMLGRRVRTVAEGDQESGWHEVRWDGRDEGGQPVASGLYVYRLQAGAFVASRMMLVVQ